MTDKQKRFCDEYLIDCNAVEAAKRAGYKGETCKNASRWLDVNSTEKYNAEMHKYIQDRLEEVQAKTIASATEVMQYLTSVMRGETTAEVVVVENIGDFMSEARTIEKRPDEKERLKAAELLGKRYSLFKDRLDIDADKGIDIKISGAGDFDEC